MQDNKVIFFPHYINQARLFDLYAILNDGYSEYEEIQSAASSEVQKSIKAETSGTSGFHLFKISGALSGGAGSEKQESESSTIHRVQTVTSILALTIRQLEEKGFITALNSTRPGSFILVPVNLKINSIKGLLDEAKRLTKLAQDISTLDKSTDRNRNNSNETPNLKQIEKVVGVVKQLFNSEEIVHIGRDHALFGNINPRNLYQSESSDIINIDLQCLAQVKRIFPQGTQLMRNTVFARIQDAESKKHFIEALMMLSRGSHFEFETTAIPEIKGIPTYQIETIALFQQASSSNATTKES